MASIISAGTTDATSLNVSSDKTGILQLASNNATVAVTIDTSQRVGIGVSSPAKALSVYAADGYIQMLNASTGTATGDGAFIGVEGGTTALRIVNQENDVMSFSTNGLVNERMRISSSGFVGINEAAPATLLHMTNGTLRIDGTTAQAIYIRGAATIKPYISINEFGTRQWDIGAGYYSAGTFSIQSNQTNGVYLGGTATSWASASDERLKDIIEPINNALTKVNGLRSVIGKYKTDEEGVRRSFLIAQDIQTQFPEALESSDSERLGVQYTDVIPLLVASIKELKAINDTQAETINALTARLEALENK